MVGGGRSDCLYGLLGVGCGSPVGGLNVRVSLACKYKDGSNDRAHTGITNECKGDIDGFIYHRPPDNENGRKSRNSSDRTVSKSPRFNRNRQGTTEGKYEGLQDRNHGKARSQHQ